MSRRSKNRFGILVVLVVGFVLGYVVACSNTQPTDSSNAAETDEGVTTKQVVSTQGGTSQAAITSPEAGSCVLPGRVWQR